MLQYRAVEQGTLDILKRLMMEPALGSFYLAGGTALALYRGHRMSIDLDLFTTNDFQADEVITLLEKTFTGFRYSNPHNPVGIFSFIDNVKVDFVRHAAFPWISNPVIEDGIRLAGIQDILAMKISAIMKRAVKKDFFDIAELLQEYSVEDFIAAYQKKYPNQQLLISVPQAMTYFADAEESETPVSLVGATWGSVKQQIQKSVRLYLG